MSDQNDPVVAADPIATPADPVEPVEPVEPAEPAVPVEPVSSKKDPYEGLTEEELKERLGKAEAAIVKNKKPKPDPEPQPLNNPGSEKTDEVPEWGQKILKAEDKRQFGYNHNLSPETVDELFQYAGGMPTEEMMEKPSVKAIIRTMEAQKRVAANTPSGGSAPTYKGKTYAETVTSSDASPDDKQKAFEAAQKKHGVR